MVAFAALDHAFTTDHDIDADICPDIPEPIARRIKRPVSLVQVLTHTAGLRNCAPLSAIGPGDTDVSDIRFDAAIGHFSYSNAGYALIGAWIERRTGLNFDGWLHLHALAHLSLTGIATRPPEGATIAQGHVRDPETGRPTPFRFYEADGRFAPAGFLWATVEGIGGLMATLLFPSGARASRSVAAMTSRASPPFGPDALCAMPGLFCTKRGGRPILFNEGEIGGFRARIELDPSAGTGLATMAAYSGPENAATDNVLATASSTTAAFPAPVSLKKERAAFYIAGGLGVFQCEAHGVMRGARLNGVPVSLQARGMRTWTGRRQDGRPVLVQMLESTGCRILSINGHLAFAGRCRAASAAFDHRWLGRYLNGYRIDVAASKDGRTVTVSSDYSGTSTAALILGPRTLATDMGIAVFRERSRRAELRLLETATFRATRQV
ncbi:serine hydrolase domain-containing protein [Pontivivens ytuae]|uniref:serine hydrolase domain-containing protein n=1 Tax=Pontivivens ytuae TaxID=2789856 RepID=UPI001E470033|nr:serine hydrolase domain-containing protein [Pontivivens ytuae]